jgi:hypothetical protein
MKTLLNQTIARSGEQDYLESEIFADKPNSMKILTLVREPVEVEKSVETMIDTPITIGHYNKDIDEVEVIGTVINAWFDKETATIKANLFLYSDTDLTEYSLGYDTELFKENNKIYQRNIKITHLSFVKTARCGKMCKIN